MQIQPPSGFSASLELDGLPVLVCGGGSAALSAIRQLLDAGAVVTVVASEIGATVADLAARGLLIMRRRPPAPDDFRGAALVVPATGVAERDQMIAAAARDHGVPAVSPSPATIEQSTGAGSVILVGGGPGDPGLLTVAGLKAIEEADVIVCDRLAPLSALQYARPEAVIIEVAKIPRGTSTSQERINEILIDHASAGKTVVRLKGGDPFVFGRGGEEWQACAAAGILVTVIPGVTSAIAGPALAGVPLTHRELTQGFTVISGHAPPGDRGLNPQLAGTGNREHHLGDHDGRRHAADHHRRVDQARAGYRHAGHDGRRRRNAKPAVRTRHSGEHRRTHRRGGHQTARDYCHWSCGRFQARHLRSEQSG